MMGQHVIKEKFFKCNQCPYSGKTEHNFKQHMTVHSKQFKCTKCDQVFSKKQSLQNHLKKHELPDMKEFVCHCKKTFKSSRALNIHKIKFHKEKPAGERTFKCKICDYAGTTSPLLRRHEATHVKQFKCHNCDKRFALDKELQNHLSHKTTDHWSCFKIKKFTCKICKKVYLNSRLLAKHSLSHADRVQCTICQKMFSATSINIHIKNHKIKDQEPKFKCEFCTKTFHFIENLRKHSRGHKNPFACDMCGQKLHSKLKLTSHIEFHLSKSNFKCKICCMVFVAKYTLNSHCKRFHKKTFRTLKPNQ
jgi:C2H2-type zinc-finger domain/C2H2-type zinc finger/Zinc finger, C2H2 type